MLDILGTIVKNFADHKKLSSKKDKYMPTQKSRGLVREIKHEGCVWLSYVAAFALKYRVKFSVIDMNELYYIMLDKNAILKDCTVLSAYKVYQVLGTKVVVDKIYTEVDVSDKYEAVEKKRIKNGKWFYHTSLYKKGVEVYQPWPESVTSANGIFSLKRRITFKEES